jgi:predicted RNA polymerase sigma factor
VTDAAAARAESVARVAYGRLLAILAAHDGDIESAEDCLADAFAQALQVWPERGVPSNPEGWLLTVARNRRRDVRRSSAHRLSDPLDDAVRAGTLPVIAATDDEQLPDRRLALLFVCAHPAIDATVRTPLMLQAVFGFDAAQVARAFAMPPATMAQRLVRAKRRIRETRIPFTVPSSAQMPDRLLPVLEAVYGAYAIDFALVAGPVPRDSLVDEAYHLAMTLAGLLPAEPEVLGLAALLSLSLARRPAGVSTDGFVPLDAQDTRQWDAALIAQGELLLHTAQRMGRIGRFQLEAAIQSVHCARATTGVIDWPALRTLYGALLRIAPTLGARVAYAAAVGRVEGAEAGLQTLDAINEGNVDRFQPAWATRAHLLGALGRVAESVRAFDRALALTADADMRRHLQRQRDAVGARDDR